MEKLKTIAKSIWAKIPKTKIEFKDLFDKCVSFLKHWLHKIWAFLKSAYVRVNNFYQEHSKLIHVCLHGGLILFLAGLSCLWFYGFVILSLDFLDLYRDPTQESWSSQLRMAAFILIAWFGAPFLVWRTWIASKQATIAQEKSYTELFTKAVEQLGSVKQVGKDEYAPNIEVRVGALYALERIMKDSDKDAPAIIDTLTTYVKANCGKPKKLPHNIDQNIITKLQEKAPANRYDIQTALIIIGRRPQKHKSKKEMPNLTEVNMQGANLVRFNLSLCNLANAHLQGAILPGVELEEAQLYGVNLRKAILEGANLQSANLQEANLSNAYLCEANLSKSSLINANLTGADLHKANLDGANLFKTILLGVNFFLVNLKNTNTPKSPSLPPMMQMQLPQFIFAYDTMEKQLLDMFGHKTMTILPEGMKIPDHWSEADLRKFEGYGQYRNEWEAFKKEKRVG